jgi:pheromone a factor receptor
MALILIVVVVPYVFWILWLFASTLNEKYSWDYVHGPEWNSVIKVPSYGQVRLDKWGQVATGYVAFAVFGTGTDANNTYRRMLCMLGLGKIFPSLYRRSEPGSSTSSSIRAARGWCSKYSSKAWNLFSKNSTEHSTLRSNTDSSTLNNSVAADTSLHTPVSTSFQPVQSNDPILSQQRQQQQQPVQEADNGKSIYNRLFARRDKGPPILPLFSKKSEKSSPEVTEKEKSPTETVPPRVYAHVWVPGNPNTPQPTGTTTRALPGNPKTKPLRL